MPGWIIAELWWAARMEAHTHRNQRIAFLMVKMASSIAHGSVHMMMMMTW